MKHRGSRVSTLNTSAHRLVRACLETTQAFLKLVVDSQCWPPEMSGANQVRLTLLRTNAAALAASPPFRVDELAAARLHGAILAIHWLAPGFCHEAATWLVAVGIDDIQALLAKSRKQLAAMVPNPSPSTLDDIEAVLGRDGCALAPDPPAA